MPDDHRGAAIITSSWVGTGAFAVIAAITTVAPELMSTVLVLVTIALFTVGLVAFGAAYAIAIGRSRHELIGMGGLFFLVGSAPARVQRNLMGALLAQTLVAIITSVVGLSVVPSDAVNPLAFGVLTPLYGLGLAGLWGARFGTFTPRPTGRAGDG